MRLSAEYYKERASGSPRVLSLAEKAAIRSDYEEVSGKLWSDSFSEGCPNCFYDAIILIHLTMKKEQTADVRGGYDLKGGVVFKYKGKIINRKNLTKEAAEWYIQQDVNNRDKFYELANDYDSYNEEARTQQDAQE